MHVSTPQGGCHFTSGENAITILRAAMAETEKERSGRSELSKSYFDNFDMQWKLSNLALTVHLHTWPDRSHGKVRAQRVLGPGRPDSAVHAVHAVHAQLPMICLPSSLYSGNHWNDVATNSCEAPNISHRVRLPQCVESGLGGSRLHQVKLR